MLKKIVNWLVTIINITLIILTFAIAIIALVSPDTMKSVIDWMEVVISWLWNWNYLIAFLSATIESFPIVWMVLPWQTVLLLVWWFFWQEALINLIIVACLWAIIWNYIWFILGYYTWDSFFRKYWEWFWIWETELNYIKSWIHKYWPIAVILSKFHPMTRAFIPFIAWSMGMKQLSFIIYNVIWSIIWATTIVLLWVLFVSYYEVIFDNFWYIMLFILACISAYIYFFKREEFKEYMRQKDLEIKRKMWEKK